MVLFSGNTPLHQVVVAGDRTKVEELKHDRQLAWKANHWGFTALELAHLLGRDACARLLNPAPEASILIRLKGSDHIESYTREQFRTFFQVQYRPFLHFSSYADLKRAIRSCPYLLRYGSFGEDNRRLGAAMRGKLSRGAHALVSIRWIDDELGYGLFAEEDLEEGHYIGEYTGLVRRLSRLKINTNPYSFHYPTRFWSLLRLLVVDSQDEGNELRFANHSDHPNLRPACLVDRGLLHLSFFANGPIAKGTELTFDYGEDYWKIRRKVYR